MTYCEKKNCSSDREKVLKFKMKATCRKFLKSKKLAQLIIQTGKKILGFRNLQEKLEKILFFQKVEWSFYSFFFQSTGSLQITASQIICPKHYTPPKKKKIIHHVNTSWCFICSKGGALICCESCPASFHVDCLKIPDLNPEAKYFCDNCETGRMHLYGEVSHRILS